MKNYKKFKNSIELRKEENYKQLRKEVKTIEKAIEKFLDIALECTSIMNERDFLLYHS